MMMFKQKIKLLEKIAKTGIASEKDITDLTAEKMLDLPGITIDEMRALLSLQQAIKKNMLACCSGCCTPRISAGPWMTGRTRSAPPIRKFLPGSWYSVHDNIFDRNNWEYLGEY